MGEVPRAALVMAAPPETIDDDAQNEPGITADSLFHRLKSLLCVKCDIFQDGICRVQVERGGESSFICRIKAFKVSRKAWRSEGGRLPHTCSSQEAQI